MSYYLTKSNCYESIMKVLKKHEIGIGCYVPTIGDSRRIAKDIFDAVRNCNGFMHNYPFNMLFLLNFDCDLIYVEGEKNLAIYDMLNEIHYYGKEYYLLVIDDYVFDTFNGYGLMTISEYCSILNKTNNKYKINSTGFASTLRIAKMFKKEFGLRRAICNSL